MPTETIDVFCAAEQIETPHKLDVDGAGELVLTCVCGRFLKFPAGTTSEQLKEYIATHKVSNEGQVTLESIEAKKAEILAGFKGE